MSVYRIQYTLRAQRDLRNLPLDVAQKTIRALSGISDSPYLFVRKLKGTNPKHPIYSFRAMREVRVLLSLHDDVLIIHVLEVEPRKHSYRDF